jgi:hypothetical protein
LRACFIYSSAHGCSAIGAIRLACRLFGAVVNRAVVVVVTIGSVLT